MTASQRTIRRAWRALMPTALSRPISRVRSKIESASVFTIPKMAMMIARARSA